MLLRRALMQTALEFGDWERMGFDVSRIQDCKYTRRRRPGSPQWERAHDQHAWPEPAQCCNLPLWREVWDLASSTETSYSAYTINYCNLAKGWYLFIFNLVPTLSKRIHEAEPSVDTFFFVRSMVGWKNTDIPMQNLLPKKKKKKWSSCWNLEADDSLGNWDGKPLPCLQQLRVTGSQGIPSAIITISEMDLYTLILLFHLISTFVLY